MEQSITKVLQEQKVQIINDVLDRRGGGRTVGWHLRANSMLEYFKTIVSIQEAIDKNKIPYNIQELTKDDDVLEFFIMINQ